MVYIGLLSIIHGSVRFAVCNPIKFRAMSCLVRQKEDIFCFVNFWSERSACADLGRVSGNIVFSLGLKCLKPPEVLVTMYFINILLRETLCYECNSNEHHQQNAWHVGVWLHPLVADQALSGGCDG
jgi:hypothetical protein